jgi:hypothetical protein
MRTSISEVWGISVTRRISGAALAVLTCLLAATPVVAGSSPAALPTTAPQSQDLPARFDGWLSELVVWNTGYSDLVSRRGDQILSLMDGSAKVEELVNAGRTREARVWAETWARETTTAFATLDAVYGSLPPRPPAPPVLQGLERDAADTLRQQTEMRDRIGTHLRQSTEIADRFIGHVVAAASGRDEDMRALGKGYFELGIAQLGAENLMIVNSRPKAGEMGYHYSVSLEEANKAALAWMIFIQARSLERPADAADAARQIRASADASELAARTLKRALVGYRAQVSTAPELSGTPLRDTLIFVVGSMDESADIEIRIADAFRHIADVVATDDVEAALAAYDPIEALINLRIETDRVRRARMTGG